MAHTVAHVVVIAFASGVVFGGCWTKQSEDESTHRQPGIQHPRILTLTRQTVNEIGLTLSVVVSEPLRVSLTIPAKVMPNQDLEAQVGSLVQGRVRKVFVNPGDFVREGDVLMEIEGLEVGEITSNFIKAKAEFKYAEANYERQKTLLDQKVGSQKAFLEARSAYEKALAGLNAEDKRIHSIGLSDETLLRLVDSGSTAGNAHDSGILPIIAPIAGTVVERNVVTGQLVDASTTAFRIINTSTLWADGQVYEKDIPRLSGKPAVSLTVNAFPGEAFPGKVIYISPVVEEKTRTIAVRAMIPNRRGRLKPHMFGELHLPVGSGEMGLLVPEEAVLAEDRSTYLFVATSDTSFERREIQTGASDGTRVEVRSGLRKGDRVVVNAAFQLKSELMRESLEGGE